MEEIVVSRWTRYGKDRLYVSTTGGEKVGWLDLETGHRTLDRPEYEVAFERAVADHAVLVAGPSGSGRHAGAEADRAPAELVAPAHVAQPSPDERPVQSAVPAFEPGEDLAAHRAGAMAREQAVAARQAAPGRTFVARLVGVHTEERAWRIGADGEELVGAQLDKLIRKDPRWKALHAIEVGDKGSDIDHLVIGPGGVFTLNTKHHPKAKIWVGGNTFMVNGSPAAVHPQQPPRGGTRQPAAERRLWVPGARLWGGRAGQRRHPHHQGAAGRRPGRQPKAPDQVAARGFGRRWQSQTSR